MEINHRQRESIIRTTLFGLSIFWLGINVVQADPRLFPLAPEAYSRVGKPILLDIYLYNDGKTSIKVPPLSFASANWSLTDTGGKGRDVRSGGSVVVSDHGTAEIIVPAGAVLYERTELNVGAEAGDVVTVKVQLGKRRRLESNSVCIYYQ